MLAIDHPLVQHKLGYLRSKTASTSNFRRLTPEISLLMGYQMLRDLPLEEVWIDTPLEGMREQRLGGKELCLVSILRAGNGMIDDFTDLVPAARVGRCGRPAVWHDIGGGDER